MANGNEAMLARYAVRAADCGGRTHGEPADPLRGPFEIDRHRVINCTAFRRLEHKTQVFAPAHHDHFRTRLTHTLEVANIARCLAAGLGANEALAEAIALAHDLGHPPFGHAGEAALDQALAGHGGFNHNAHSLRVVEYLEHPYPAFRGLNLTAAVRAGLASHVTLYDRPERAAGASPHGREADARGSGGSSGESAPPPLKRWATQPGESAPTPSERAAGCSPRGPEADARGSGEPSCESAPPPLKRWATQPASGSPTIEAQIASLADRIAYDCHDLEDALGAGLIDAAALTGVALWGEAYEPIAAQHRDKSVFAVRRPVLDAMLDRVLGDVVAESCRRLQGVGGLSDVLAAGAPLVVASPEIEEGLRELERFLLERVYRHPDIAAMDARGREMVLALFEAYRSDPGRLPQRFRERIGSQDVERVIGDYIAGMTDRFCGEEYRRWVR
ncbi:MAG: dNTP triphosphohydrolase [Planctomycetes bacterium]|nr:dNTP triphosphohydrolase [Planctomycetota bacterium]